MWNQTKCSLFQRNLGLRYIIVTCGWSRLTCPPPAPHQIQHETLELLSGHTNRSSEQQQTLSENAQTTKEQN